MSLDSQSDGLPDETSENPQFKTMSEAIQALENSLPDDIRRLYCVGGTWEEILKLKDSKPDDMVETIAGIIPAKLFLAAYAINVVAQGMLCACALGEKTDPVTMEFSPMSPDEKLAIEQLQIPMVIEFVANKLGVPVFMTPEPFVCI